MADAQLQGTPAVSGTFLLYLERLFQLFQPFCFIDSGTRYKQSRFLSDPILGGYGAEILPLRPPKLEQRGAFSQRAEND